ncbi:DUF6794 domain-containing protein [Sphingobacterium pedocola]|nr:DUF6794 domain-containing protein [Sphingobacterium pedocola]
MKFYYLSILSYLISINACLAQYGFSNGTLQIGTVNSQNRIFKIVSMSYDDQFPTTRGRSIIYKNDKILYVIPRSFDILPNNPNSYLAISNDGLNIVYLVAKSFLEDDEHKHVTLYHKGKLKKAYTLDEFTGCNSAITECSLFYSSYNETINPVKITEGDNLSKQTLDENYVAEELLLRKQPVLIKNDTLYCTDSKKNTTVLDLKTGQIIGRGPFSSFYNAIKDQPKDQVEIVRHDKTYIQINDFLNQRSDKKVSEEIADLLNMRYIHLDSSKRNVFKEYNVSVTGLLGQDGTFEIEQLTAESPLNKNLIADYFKSNIFKSDFVKKEIGKEYFKYFFGTYRNVDESMAKKERTTERIEQEKIKQANLIADSIGDVYIPKNLEECFSQLNIILKPVDLEKLKSSAGINYHMGLGMWIRNNWGLWGASRLQQYFIKRGYSDPDSISSVILDNYISWLNGETDIAEAWEKNNVPKTSIRNLHVPIMKKR